MLISNRKIWEDAPVRWAVQTGIIISYARPFGNNIGLGSLPAKFHSIGDPDAQRVHDRTLVARNTLEAHTNLLERGGLIAGHVPGDDTLNIRITVDGDGQIFWDINTASLGASELKRLLRLIVMQQERVKVAADALLLEMWGERSGPPGEYRLGVDFP